MTRGFTGPTVVEQTSTTTIEEFCSNTDCNNKFLNDAAFCRMCGTPRAKKTVEKVIVGNTQLCDPFWHGNCWDLPRHHDWKGFMTGHIIDWPQQYIDILRELTQRGSNYTTWELQWI
jgi:hypothetical protein